MPCVAGSWAHQPSSSTVPTCSLPARLDHYGLSCRMYKRRDGRVSPLPDVDDLRAALSAALSHGAPAQRKQLVTPGRRRTARSTPTG